MFKKKTKHIKQATWYKNKGHKSKFSLTFTKPCDNYHDTRSGTRCLCTVSIKMSKYQLKLRVVNKDFDNELFHRSHNCTWQIISIALMMMPFDQICFTPSNSVMADPMHATVGIITSRPPAATYESSTSTEMAIFSDT